MDIEKAIKTRKSVKRYSTTKKPDWRKILRAIDTARYAPMAGNLFNLKFILISNKNKISKIADASSQPFIKDAPYIVVVISDTEKQKRMYEERGIKYTRQQAGAAIQNILLMLNNYKYATCWIGHFEDSIVKRELKIPDKLDIEAILPIGIETKIKTEQKSKAELDGVMFFDEYKNKKMEKHTMLKTDAS